MNDSFLEDLKLVPLDPKPGTAQGLNRHVTTRVVTSSPIQLPESKLENLLQKRMEYGVTDQHSSKEPSPKDIKRISERDAKKQVRGKIPEKREKSGEYKLKPIENRVRADSKEIEIKDNIKKKLERETKVKITDSKLLGKDRTRRSGSCKENNHATDVSSKENSRPDSSKESTSQAEVCKEKGKKCDCTRRSEIKENDPVVLVSAIKDIVSSYTKHGTTTVLKAMQELHLKSQANLIRELIFQKDDLLEEMHPAKESSRIRALIDHNERLQEEVMILQKQNVELQKRLEELEAQKQENIALNVKCKDLSKH